MPNMRRKISKPLLTIDVVHPYDDQVLTAEVEDTATADEVLDHLRQNGFIGGNSYALFVKKSSKGAYRIVGTLREAEVDEADKLLVMAELCAGE